MTVETDAGFTQTVAGRLTALDLDCTVCYTRPSGQDVTIKRVSMVTHTRKHTIIRGYPNHNYELKKTHMVKVYPPN